LFDLYSEGKKSIILGMVKLFTFVKMLEEDWNALMRGISIEYGEVTKKQADLSLSMGWLKKRKLQDLDHTQPASTQQQQHEGENDGRAPNTTATLLPETVKKKNTGQKGKPGHPKKSPNIDRNQMTTFPSYCASNESKTRN
jgi:hypothetical protein